MHRKGLSAVFPLVTESPNCKTQCARHTHTHTHTSLNSVVRGPSTAPTGSTDKQGRGSDNRSSGERAENQEGIFRSDSGCQNCRNCEVSGDRK